MTSSVRNRRRFLGEVLSLMAVGALPLRGLGALQATQKKPLSILVLGGTGFVGPHFVRRAVERGHTVSIFTRGRRDGDLPAGIERLVGDRNGKLEALAGRKWDVVIDDSATNPAWVKQSAELLKDSTNRYLFTSSTGVYYPYLELNLDESHPVHTEMKVASDLSEDFGVKKAQCEAIVTQTFGNRGIVVRPTYIVGPGDYTDRFTYWPVRLERGGEILAPGNKSDRVQFIDVRDLAAFMLNLVENDASGIFNAIGPRNPMNVDQFLARAMRAIDAHGTLVWVNDYDLLLRNEIDGLVPWILTRGNDLGHTSIVSKRSWNAGLTLRPMEETVRDTLAWFKAQTAERKAGARWVLKEDKERALLAEWHKAHG